MISQADTVTSTPINKKEKYLKTTKRN